MIQLQSLNVRYQVPKNWKVGPSFTNLHVLALITEGSLYYRFEKETIKLHGGDVLFMPIHTYRTALPCPPHYHKMSSVHFQASSNEELLPLLRLEGPKVFKPDNFDYIKHRFSILTQLWNERLPYYEMQNQAVFMEILVLMSRELELGQHTLKKRHIVQKLSDHMKSHYQEKLQLADLARVVDRTPNYICHLFKEILGQTPIEYLNQTRIAAARDLMLNSDQPLADIAEQVGFSDPYYFSKVYKKVTGMPPKRSATE